MKLNFSKRDVAAGTILEPGLYAAKIATVSQQAAKDKQSMNYVVELLVGDNEVPVRKFYNEKFLSPMIPLLKAAGADVDADGFEIDLNALVGVELKVSIINGSYNNKPTNEIDAFMPA